MASRLVAVDFDSRSVRLLQLRNGRVERWASAPLEEGVVVDGVVTNPGALGNAIKQLKRSSGITARQAVASVSGLFSIVQTEKAPQVDPYMLSDAILDPDEADSEPRFQRQWRVTATEGTSRYSLAVWADGRQIDSHLQAIQSAGLRLKTLEPKSTCLFRAVARPVAVVVNVEPASLDVVMVKGGWPAVIRTVPLQETDSVEALVEQVVRAIEITLTFDESQAEEEPVDLQYPLFLVGPSSESPSLRQFVQDRVENETSPFTPPLDLPPHFPTAEFAVAIGLALKSVKQPEPRAAPLGQLAEINLIPRRRSKWQVLTRLSASMLALGIAASAALFLTQLYADAAEERSKQERELLAAEAKVGELRTELRQLAEIEADIQALQRLLASQARITGNRDLILAAVTPGVELTSLQIEGNTVTLTARAETVAQAIALVESLRSTGRFESVPYPRASTNVNLTLNVIEQ